MIYITQGHEKGIGLEVFFKALLCFSSTKFKNFKFVGYRKAVEETLKSLSIPYQISKDSIKLFNKEIHCHFLLDIKYSQTLDSILHCLNIIKDSDILITLPSSKDQFIFKKEQFNGHTEFFRNYFKTQLTMSFLSNNDSISLTTDHVAIRNVGSIITSSLLEKSIIDSYQNISALRPVHNILVTGINPHCGENGLIGNEDEVIFETVKKLKNSLPILGPFPADTVNYHKRANDIVHYMFHDQGLSFFKSKNGLQGINLSCGLPFLRVSVDHGTAFELFGRNIADYSGMLYLLNFFLK